MSWDKVIGQERVKNLLKQILRSGKLPSALLFEGPEGVGKDALAIELAKTLNCERNKVDPCEECISCRQANALHHPNIRFVFPLPRGENETKEDGPLDKLDEKTIRKIREELALKAENPYHRISIPRAQVIKISSIREVIREDSLSLYQHGHRVVIVMQAEEVGTESANALLKVLEEPNPGTIFILTTSRRSSLLPTIVSRCQSLRFDLLSEDEIMRALILKHAVSTADAKLKARLAGGSYTKAVDLLETDTLDIREEALDLLRDVATNNYSRIAFRGKKAIESKDLRRIETLLKMLQIWLRDAAVMHVGLPRELINQDKTEILERMTKSFDGGKLVDAANSIDGAISQLYSNVNLGLLFVNLLMNLSGMLNRKKELQNV
ncbi:MAG TPA: DNA polymerase III subunit delta' C-terminal domain-containing protein [Candidatus Acidoferrales bacterium]|nr:DNA polymerase III subunit delta' C-terminal domain-containing protein [Candidatus Acidoferrales bacterium]